MTRNALGAALELVNQAQVRLAQLQQGAPSDIRLVLLDLYEVLDHWSKRDSPAITRLQREEFGREFLEVHRLLTRAGLEFDGLHELLTRAENAIDQAQGMREVVR